MRVTGHIGSAVVAELLAAGHRLVGLARSDDAAHALDAAGVEVHHGSLEDHESLRAGAAKAEGVIHLAWNHDNPFQEHRDIDQRAIENIGAAIVGSDAAIVGSDKPLIVPNGMAGLKPSGQIVTEDDNVPDGYKFPRTSELRSEVEAERWTRHDKMLQTEQRQQGIIDLTQLQGRGGSDLSCPREPRPHDRSGSSTWNVTVSQRGRAGTVGRFQPRRGQLDGAFRATTSLRL